MERSCVNGRRVANFEENNKNRIASNKAGYARIKRRVLRTIKTKYLAEESDFPPRHVFSKLRISRTYPSTFAGSYVLVSFLLFGSMKILGIWNSDFQWIAANIFRKFVRKRVGIAEEKTRERAFEATPSLEKIRGLVERHPVSQPRFCRIISSG